MKILNILNRPYPTTDSVKEKLFISVVFGIFIGLFLLIFQPFDIATLEHNHKTIFILGYGFVTFISLLITFIIFPYLFKKFYKNTWTTWKEIIHMMSVMLLIALLNITYSLLFCDECSPFKASVFSEVILFSLSSVLVIGILPITFMVLIYQNILLKKNARNAEIANQSIIQKALEKTSITIYSNNNKNILNINTNQLLIIEANGNYINVYYEEDNKLKREVIRNTLKKNENIIENYSNIIRCHKSYIVNLSNLKKVTGNAQGYKLTFNFLNFEVPVSRNLSKNVITKIQNLT